MVETSSHGGEDSLALLMSAGDVAFKTVCSALVSLMSFLKLISATNSEKLTVRFASENSCYAGCCNCCIRSVLHSVSSGSRFPRPRGLRTLMHACVAGHLSTGARVCIMLPVPGNALSSMTVKSIGKSLLFLAQDCVLQTCLHLMRM